MILQTSANEAKNIAHTVCLVGWSVGRSVGHRHMKRSELKFI